MPGTKLICVICGRVYGFMSMRRGETPAAPLLPTCQSCTREVLGIQPGTPLCAACRGDEGIPRYAHCLTAGMEGSYTTMTYRCDDCQADYEAWAAAAIRRRAEESLADDDDWGGAP
jgi:hypothetical protein